MINDTWRSCLTTKINEHLLWWIMNVTLYSDLKEISKFDTVYHISSSPASIMLILVEGSKIKLPKQIDDKDCFLTLTHAVIGTEKKKKSCFFVTYYLKFEHLFHKLMHQYQACLYLFECTSLGDSKYGHEIAQNWHFLQHLLDFCLSSALACRV